MGVAASLGFGMDHAQGAVAWEGGSAAGYGLRGIVRVLREKVWVRAEPETGTTDEKGRHAGIDGGREES